MNQISNVVQSTVAIASTVCDIDCGAELLQLNRPNKGQNQPDQKRDQRHNRQGVGTAILDSEHQIRAA